MDKIFTLPNDLNLDPGQSIQLYNYEISNSNLNTKINLQSNVISFLQEGSKEVTTSQKFLSVNNDHFLLLKSGHCLMSETISNQKRYKSTLLFFSNELITSILDKHIPNRMNEKEEIVMKSCAYDTYLRSFVQSLQNISSLGKRSQQAILPVKIEELVLYLLETKGIHFLQFLINRRSQKEVTFKDIVEANKFNKLTLKELAFLAHMSLSTFKREFEKHYDLSPIKWFQNQRLEHAAHLLKNKNLRPTDIYDDIGYDSLSNFIYAFKKKFNVTPKQFQLK
ncbi:MAG: AraC family transcriptional regulator [Bacteroidota bacterium]